MGDRGTAELRARADAYRLLGIFLQLPTAEVARGVVDGSVGEDLASIGGELGLAPFVAGRDLSAMGEIEETLSALRRDYTRLFTNPEKPLVCVYESGFKGVEDYDTSKLLFVSPTAIHAECAYRSFGLEMAGEHRDSPDHMGAELDFMCCLYGELADARLAGDGERAIFVEGELDAFKREHFVKWAPGFFAAVAQHAQTPTYRMLGEFGALLADSEA